MEQIKLGFGERVFKRTSTITMIISFALGGLLLFSTLPAACHDSRSRLEVSEQERRQWNAYGFHRVVTPLRGDPGILKTFDIVLTLQHDNALLSFHVEGTYEGVEIVEIETRKIQKSSSGNERSSIVTSRVECIRLKHKISLLQNSSANQNYPDEAEITVWIPTDHIRDSQTTFGICARAACREPVRGTASWSFYLSDDMQSDIDRSAEGEEVRYEPFSAGDFFGLDADVIYPIYGLTWQAFSVVAEGGRFYLEDRDFVMENPGGDSLRYNSFSVHRIIGDCDFRSMEITQSSTYASGASMTFMGSFYADMPLPFYFRFDSTDGRVESAIRWYLDAFTLSAA